MYGKNETVAVAGRAILATTGVIRRVSESTGILLASR